MFGTIARLRLAIAAVGLIKRVAPSAISHAFSKCIKELEIHRKHVAAVRRGRKLVNRKPLKLELGGGIKPKPGWINIDLRSADGLTLDLRQPLPFPDESVAEIYSEHALECLAYPGDLAQLLVECHRVLMVGGKFTAGVPDAGNAFKAYAAGPAAFYASKDWANVRPGSVRCPMDELNWLIYQGGTHHYMFDEQNLRLRLEETGFVEVKKRDATAADSIGRRHQTLYVEAQKSNDLIPDIGAIRARHTQALIDQISADASIAPAIVDLATGQRYAVLRLAMSISGEWGETLLIGQEIVPILPLLDSFDTPTGRQTSVIVRPDSNQRTAATDTDERIRYQDYPPFPYQRGQFRRMLTIIDDTAVDILTSASELLTSEKDGRIYVVAPATGVFEIPSAFTCPYQELLPADAGVLYVLKRAMPSSGKVV
jgi:predicted SAM-dependent methyltransferase